MSVVNKGILILFVCCLFSCSESKSTKLSVSESSKKTQIWPKINSVLKHDPQLETRVAHMLKQMTLEQKVAQMIQPEIRDITVEDMRRYGFGSYLNGGGAFPNNNKHSTPADWIELAEKMYQASIDDSLDGSRIPTMWGTDAVHGHNNVIGATLFPHNIGLGAMNNAPLIEQIAQATATEVMVTGIDWVFAPTVATVRDDRWGRSYESYSEDPEIVKAYASAIVEGLQGTPNQDFLADNRVISTVKHFIGDGGTVDGVDQGNNPLDETELFRLHGQGYVGGLNAGAQTVMASFNSWQGKKIHGSRYLLTNVLKDKMGFDGFVVGDWNGHGQVKGCSNENCPQAINAGLDVFMVPTDAWKSLMENTIQQVLSGRIPMARIDDAVSRILRVKFRAGLFNKPSPANRMYSGKTELIGHEEHRKIARQAVRESLVLLKNKNKLLPLNPNLNFLIAGDAADNIGKQSGGWTITWQGTGNKNQDFPTGTSIYQGIKNQVQISGGKIELSVDGNYQRRPDVAIVVFGEEPYAEGQGDRTHLEFESGNKKSLMLLTKLKQADIPVVSIFISGRPMYVNPELNQSDAFVAAWLPGSEGEGIADVLLRNQLGKIQHDFKGKLSFSWPKTPYQLVNIGDKPYAPLLPFGFGLTYADNNLLSDKLPLSTASRSNLAKPNRLNEGSATSIDFPIFRGGIKAPWSMALVNSEQQREVIANVQTLEGIAYRTVDRDKQEDAVQLTFSGLQTAGFQIFSQGKLVQDISQFDSSKTMLVFDLKLLSAINNSLSVSMECQFSQQCRSQVHIGEQLKTLPINQWHRLSLSLECFERAGVNFKNMISPFGLASNEKIKLELSNIIMSSQVSNAVKMSCD
jgi:beta-glucosidase